MHYVVIIILKYLFPIKRKQGVNNCFDPLISSVFTTAASRLKLEQKEKGIINLETKYNFQYSVKFYEINENSFFSFNN